MKKIFIGLFFLFLNFNINLPGVSLNLMPTFVGHILIALGLGEEPERPSSAVSRTVARVAAVVSGLVWGVEFFGVSIGFPLSTVGILLQLLMTWQLVRWCGEGEETGGETGLTRRFRLSWYALAGAALAAYIMSYVDPGYAAVWLVVFLIAAVYYIYTFYRLWKTTAGAE